MRRDAVAIALLVGCGGPVPRATEPADRIAPDTFAWKLAGLRATLARSDVALEDGDVVRTCEGLHEAGACVRCEVATHADTSGLDPEMIDGAAIAFARYPTAVLAAARLERVALCRRIRYEGDDPERGPAGVADLAGRRVLVSIEHFAGTPHRYAVFTIEEVVHHEVFHLLDHATQGERALDDREWRALNPPAFSYRDPAIDGERPAGFVNTYATTNELEDRASVFEYLMGHPSWLCEIAAADPIVAKKATLVWRRVARVTGEAFLERHAACFRPEPIAREPAPAKQAKAKHKAKKKAATKPRRGKRGSR